MAKSVLLTGSLALKLLNEYAFVNENLCLFVLRRIHDSRESYFDLTEALSRGSIKFAWSHSHALHFWTLWDSILYEAPLEQPFLGNSIRTLESASIKGKLAIMRHVLTEYGDSGLSDMLPDVFMCEVWSDDMYIVYCVILLTATDTRTLDTFICPLLISPAAVSHISRIIALCEPLLSSVVNCIIRSIEQRGLNITNQSSSVTSQNIPILWLYSSILMQIAAQDYTRTGGDVASAKTIRDCLAAKKILPSVCIDISRRFDLGIDKFLCDQIPSNGESTSARGDDKERMECTVGRVEITKLWMFEPIGTGLLRDLLLDLLSSAVDLLSTVQSFDSDYYGDKTYGIAFKRKMRVACVLLTILHFRADTGDPSTICSSNSSSSSGGTSGNGNPAAGSSPTPLARVVDSEIERRLVKLADELFRLMKMSLSAANSDGLTYQEQSSSSPSMRHASFVAQCLRRVVPLILTAIASFNSLSHHTSTAPSSADTSHFTTLLIKLLCFTRNHAKDPVQQKSAISSLYHTHHDLLVYCTFMKCAFSLNRIVVVREMIAREIDLVWTAEFIPQGAYIFIAQTVSAASVVSNSVFGYNEEDKRGVSLTAGRIGLIERNKEVLLVHFRLLPFPSEISSVHEFPGDWMCLMHLLLSCHILVNTSANSGSSSATFSAHGTPSTDWENVDVMERNGDNAAAPPNISYLTLRETMNYVLRTIRFPPHSLLVTVIDMWLDLSVNGYDDGGGSMLPPFGADGCNSGGIGAGNVAVNSVSNGAVHRSTVSAATTTSTTSGIGVSGGNVTGRDVIPFLPDDIKELADPLNSFTLPFVRIISTAPQPTDTTHFHTFISDIIREYGEISTNRQAPPEPAYPLLSDSLLSIMYKQLCSSYHPATSLPRPTIADITSHDSAVYRAAIACYTSLRHQWLCMRSPRTGYTCVLHCSPYDIPVKRCLLILLATVRWMDMYSPCGSDAVPYPSQCADYMLTSFTHVVKQLCPELLLKERMHGLMWVWCSVDSDRVPLCSDETTSTSNGNAEPPMRVKPSQQSMDKEDFLLDIIQNPSQEVLALVTLISHGDTVPPFASTSTYSCTRQGENALRKVTNLTVNITRRVIAGILADSYTTGHTDYSARAIFNIWKVAHALHPRPSCLELEMFNCLLELGNVRRPQMISSYSILIQEPILIFRLPVSLLRIPLVMELILFIFRSLLIASRTQAHEALRCIRARYSLWNKATAQPTDIPKSQLQACEQVDDSQFANLQEVISIRLLFELWHSVSEGIALEGHRDEEQLSAVIIKHVSTVLAENRPILDVVMHYGIRYWSCFLLIAQCENLLVDVADMILHGMTTALEQQAPSTSLPSVWSSGNLTSILVHFHFLLRSSAVKNPCRLDLVDKLDQIAEVLYRFVKRSLKYAGWTQPRAQSHLAQTCCETLTAIADAYPHHVLRIICCLTKHEVVEGCPPHSVLTSMQGILKDLHVKICQNAVQLSSPKRIRSSSELRDSDAAEGVDTGGEAGSELCNCSNATKGSIKRQRKSVASEQEDDVIT